MSSALVDVAKRLCFTCQAHVWSVCRQCLRRAVTIARDNRMKVLSYSLFEQRRLVKVSRWTSREAPDLPLRTLESMTGSTGLAETVGN